MFGDPVYPCNKSIKTKPICFAAVTHFVHLIRFAAVTHFVHLIRFAAVIHFVHHIRFAHCLLVVLVLRNCEQAPISSS